MLVCGLAEGEDRKDKTLKARSQTLIHTLKITMTKEEVAASLERMEDDPDDW